MTANTLAKKYSNFYAPNCQITINEVNLQQPNNQIPTNVIVELAETQKFIIEFNTATLEFVNSDLIEPNKEVIIKMGYSNNLETIISAKISSVKTIFPSSGPPQLKIEGKNAVPTKVIQMGKPSLIATLQFGKDLYSFSSETISGSNIENSIINCKAECLGLPEIGPDAALRLSGLGAKFSKIYIVEKVVHTFGDSGYSTTFEGKTIKERIFQRASSIKR